MYPPGCTQDDLDRAIEDSPDGICPICEEDAQNCTCFDERGVEDTDVAC